MTNSGGPETNVICPSCGRTLPPGARFCGFDGTHLSASGSQPRIQQPQPTQTTAVPGGEKFCPTCRKIFPVYAGFCPVDATKLVPNPNPSVHKDTIVTTSSRIPALNPNQVTPPAAASPPLNQVNTGTQEVVSIANLQGKTIGGKYEVQSILGEGGMAVVYKAYHKHMERTVVIKVMQGWLMSNKNSLERFEREYKLTAKLNHPNIVNVYDVGFLSQQEPYLVMEFIKGESLAEKVGRQGAMPLATVANITIQICRGLQEAHSMGIIHRDLKPENILLQEKSDRPDWVKIVDFGISHLVAGSKRLTKTGKMVGTPEYIAPEQLRDRPIDIRADIYALGIIIFEMLTGTVPFTAESTEAVLMKHLLEDTPQLSTYREDISDDSLFSQIVIKALQKNPDDRYQTATELRLDMEQALHQVMLNRRAPGI